MKDGIVATEKQSLQSMLVTKNILLDAIYDNDGEIDDQQTDSLMELETNIPVKIDGWSWTLMKNGAIDKEIELWQNRKEVVENIIKSLRNGKDRLKARAHQIMQMNKLERLDGNEYWIKRDFSKSRTVLLDQVEDEFKKYELPVLNYQQYSTILNVIENYPKVNGNGNLKEVIRIISELHYLICNDTTEKCNVTDLPSDHFAIVVEEKPTIRIYPKR